jgi:DNA-binding MarR family transcriptional regulator
MPLQREKSAGYMVNWAARLFAREIHARISKEGLSPGHLPVFFALADGVAMTQKELAKRAAIEQPTMAATLARMERDGLIVRKADPADRRSSLVSLSPAAAKKTAAVRAAVNAVNSHALSRLSADERDAFLRMLGTVIGTLRLPDE